MKNNGCCIGTIVGLGCVLPILGFVTSVEIGVVVPVMILMAV